MQTRNMRIVFLFIVLFSNVLFIQAQRVHIGVAGGLANYNGDLLDELYHKKLTNGFIGLTAHYELQDQILIRGAFNFARVNGSDIYNDDAVLKQRNLHFESAISEFSVVGEYYLFNLYEKRFSPYGFIGLAIFHFNPYAYDSSERKVFLKPLSTEGQGLYPNKKPYSLWQPAIPMGGGVKFAITENLRIGFEIGLRKLFTDHLDDVSTSYPDFNDLLAARGQTAVDFSYRGDEVPGGDAIFPSKDTQRGGSTQKDIYYFTGINISFKPFAGGGGGGGRSGFGKKGRYGCPTVPL
jgi:Domain of unknown function (DUF6089)